MKGPVRPDAKTDVGEAVGAYLFSERNVPVYAILDGASVDGLVDYLHRYEPEFECLYRGELAPDLAEVAPYLIRLDRKSAFTDWVLAGGWGNHWGVFAISKADLPSMRRHFRKFLTVHTTEGSPMLFRYYDPRVLRAYLPTCDAKELDTIFGPVLNFTLEGEDSNELLRFQFAGGSLVRHAKKLNEEG